MKFPLLAILLSAGVTAGSAQEPLSFGLTGGAVLSRPHVSQFGTSAAGTIATSTSASAGGVLRIPLEGFLFFQAEPSWVRKGLAWTLNLGGTPYDVTASADYLEVPLFVGASFDLGSFSPYLLIGPAVAYKVAERWDAVGPPGPLPDFYVRYDVAVNGGGGVLYQAVPGASVFLQARYSLGLNQVNRSGSGGLYSSEARFTAGVLLNMW